MKYSLTVFLLLVLASFAAHAELHKWVDSEGKVHYSDEPPPEGVETETIRTAPVPASATAASGPAPAKTIYEQEAERKKSVKAKEEAAQKAAQKEEETKQKQKNCEQSRSQLMTMQNAPRVTTYTESGERVIMDDAARQKAIGEAQEAVSKYCQ